MFETGLTDTITVKKKTAGEKDAQGNPTQTWAVLIDAQKCRVVEYSETVSQKATGTTSGGALKNLATVRRRKVMVNYTGSDLDPDCLAEVNGIQEDIEKVTPARGFGRNFYNIYLKGAK